MTTAVASITREQALGRLLALSGQRQIVIQLKTGGDYRIRLLPGGGGAAPEDWLVPYSLHFVRGQDAAARPTIFVCEKATYGRKCKVCSAVYAAKDAAKSPGGVDPLIAKLADKAGSGRRFLANAVIVAGPQDADPGRVVTLEVTKLFFDRIERFANRVNFALQDLQLGQEIKISLAKRAQGDGFDYNLDGYEPVKPAALASGVLVTHEMLPDLQSVLRSEKLANAHPAESFTGDFLNPLAGPTTGLAAAASAWAPPFAPPPPVGGRVAAPELPLQQVLPPQAASASADDLATSLHRLVEAGVLTRDEAEAKLRAMRQPPPPQLQLAAAAASPAAAAPSPPWDEPKGAEPQPGGEEAMVARLAALLGGGKSS